MSVQRYGITPPSKGFAGVPVETRIDDLEADVAFIGLHYKSPYPHPATGKNRSAILSAPEAIRRQSLVFSDHLHHHDFNFGGPLLANRDLRIVDCGDIEFRAEGGARNPEHITEAIRTLRYRGVLPIAMGTDEGGAIPAIRAFNGFGNLCVVHLDAHIDWRNERDGVRNGYSSVMRRVSEMPWVGAMVQIGMRGIGSARKEEIDAALSFGSVFIPAREVHELGVQRCMKKIPSADHYLVTIDTDAFDLAIAPGVLYPSPGGLTFEETTDLLDHLARKAPITGLNVFEVRPEKDINNITAMTITQLLIHFLGIVARNDWGLVNIQG